jgi:ATP-dependent RNA helicase SUPV3L1/SUV3
MAKTGKYWPFGALKSRGWTDELTKKLLPRPIYRHFNDKAVRVWKREDILAAEQTDAFRSAAESFRAQAPASDSDVESALAAAAAFLSDAWAAAEKPDDTESVLALKYHETIQKQLPGAAWADKLKAGQATSYIERFLNLRRERPGDTPYAALRRFVTAGPWLGRNLTSGLAQNLRDGYAQTLLAVAGRALREFSAEQPEANAEGLIAMEKFPSQELFNHPLGYIWSVFYVPRAIRTSLNLLVALNPKDEYPEARAMSRHFILHIGGTNTGKTYAGFQRLIEAGTGVYLAPLRLLALEAQEVLLGAGVRCALTTGEEEDREEGDTHVAATAEKLDLHQRYEVAVVDECQMIADRARGYAWTRAILGVLAPEVHLCAAPEAKNLLIKLIKSCGDSFEVVTHRRKTPLVCMDRTVDFETIRPGDALITFSKVGVLSVAEDLRSRGKKPAIIYGALPYSTRRKQVEGFLHGDMEYVVSTDAIGMGLNLPIRRIIFLETEKFDGVERRPLRAEEIQQIAGRAGRFGMYDKGYVGATENLGVIRAALETVVPPLQTAVVGFSDLVMQVDFDLLEVLEVWNRMPTADLYVKLDISRYITVISRLRENGFRLTKEQELRAANIPYDETDEELNRLFVHFLRLWRSGQTLERPALQEKQGAYTLPELEQYCRKLDLYFSFSKAFGCPVDRDGLHEEREKTAERINQILLHNLRNNIRFCSSCGAALPLHSNGRLCTVCYARRFGRPRSWRGR